MYAVTHKHVVGLVGRVSNDDDNDDGENCALLTVITASFLTTRGYG